MRASPGAIPPCSVDDCGTVSKTRGMCGKHAERVRKWGNPHRTEKGGWTADAVTYEGIHQRLRAQRGRAAEQMCACGSPARQWAFTRDCTDQRLGRFGPMCPHVEHYVAMCVPCHKRFDLSHVG